MTRIQVDRVPGNLASEHDLNRFWRMRVVEPSKARTWRERPASQGIFQGLKEGRGSGMQWGGASCAGGPQQAGPEPDHSGPHRQGKAFKGGGNSVKG